MRSATLNESRDWLCRPLCRRYAFVQLAGFHVPELEDGVPRQRHWCWAFAMFSADEFEILGAWPTDTAAVEQIADDLRKRGVLSIRVMSFSEVECHASTGDLQSRAIALRNADPRVLEVLRTPSGSGEAVEGVTSATIRSAVSKAGRINDGLVRGVHLRSPFVSAGAASRFIAIWLQAADRRLYAALRPAKPAASPADQVATAYFGLRLS